MSKHPGGRPSLYRPEFAKQARKLADMGATDEQLADFFEVTIQTIKNWYSEKEEFFSAVMGSKRHADKRVQRSLYQRAVGYTYEAKKIFQHNGQIIEAPYHEHVPPDTTAMIFWLKNRQPKEWRDKREHEMGGAVEVSGGDLRTIGQQIAFALALAVQSGDGAAAPALIEARKSEGDGGGEDR